LLLHILNRFYNEKVVPKKRHESSDEDDEDSDDSDTGNKVKPGEDYPLNASGVYKIFDHKYLG